MATDMLALWARIVRGVKPEYWLTPCARCGFTGKVHQHGLLTPCWRFKPPTPPK